LVVNFIIDVLFTVTLSQKRCRGTLMWWVRN